MESTADFNSHTMHSISNDCNIPVSGSRVDKGRLLQSDIQLIPQPLVIWALVTRDRCQASASCL